MANKIGEADPIHSQVSQLLATGRTTGSQAETILAPITCTSSTMATQAMCRVSQAAQAGELHVVRGGDDDEGQLQPFVWGLYKIKIQTFSDWITKVKAKMDFLGIKED